MAQPTTIELDKDSIIKQVTALNDVAKKNKWVLEYDSELDELVYGLETMPANSFLFNINDEINLFITPDSKVNGLFIEYFKGNYLEHNKEFQPVLEILEEEEFQQSISEDVAKVSLVKKALENELLVDTLRTLVSKDKLITAV